MRKCLLSALLLAPVGALGCGSDAPKAEPKFREPPKATIGQIDEKGGVQGEAKSGEKTK